MTASLAALVGAGLDAGTIRIITARLDAPPLPVEELRVVASADELDRAARFLHEADRNRHIIGRALTRLALAQLMKTTPASIRFQTSEFGKPRLAHGPSFNLSHSGNAIVLALAPGGRLGVDVEAVRDLRDLLGLARTSFAYDELCTVATMPLERRVRPFFRTWARKEAMLKALGLGLTALDSISVSADEAISSALLRLDLTGEQVSSWTLRPIACGAEVESAVAWDRPLRSIEFINL